MTHIILYIVIGSIFGLIAGTLLFRRGIYDFGELEKMHIGTKIFITTVSSIVAIIFGGLWPLVIVVLSIALFMYGLLKNTSKIIDKGISIFERFKRVFHKIDQEDGK